jgi:hypothetical protein
MVDVAAVEPELAALAEPHAVAARNLLLAGGPWNSRWGGPEGREKGVAGEKGTSGKTEMLKTETLKGRMLGGRPRSGGTRGF